MDSSFPGIVPRDLPNATGQKRLLFPVPLPDNLPLPEKRPLPENHPPYLAMRFDQVVSSETNDLIIRAWDRMNELGVVFPDPDPTCNRSSSPALHLGVWELYDEKPRVTSDSRNQSPEVVQAIDDFLLIIQQRIAPRLKNLLKEFCPQQHELQMRYVFINFYLVLNNIYIYCRAHKRVQRRLHKEFKGRPALDFGGPFFTVAVKEGSSENIHIDFNDFRHSVTWVVPLGDWTGGEFCAPQLGEKIPICPGQVFGGLTGILAHCSAPVKQGRRIILTLFSDKFLMSHGLKKVRR